jgi:hypothetical protein
MENFAFHGAVGFRSSVPGAKGPPGEAELFKLNPQRASQILAVTSWPRLEPGSLNLEVQGDVLEKLMSLTPAWVEDGSTVKYPPPYEAIPRKRVAYLYFRGDAIRDGKSEPVLVRRGKVPVPGRVELFAAVSLKGLFALSAKDRLEVRMHAI